MGGAIGGTFGVDLRRHLRAQAKGWGGVHRADEGRLSNKSVTGGDHREGYDSASGRGRRCMHFADCGSVLPEQVLSGADAIGHKASLPAAAQLEAPAGRFCTLLLRTMPWRFTL